jgi:hypothetical protein
MKMKKYNDDVEALVGNPERKAAIDAKYDSVERKKQSEMVKKGIFNATGCALFGVMGVMGWAVPWIAIPFCVAFGLAAAFTFGRWYENGKILGWK